MLRCSTEHLPTSRSSMIHMFSTTLPVCLTGTTKPLTTTRKHQLNASPTITPLVSRNPCMIRRFLNTQTKESFSLLENLEQPLYNHDYVYRVDSIVSRLQHNYDSNELWTITFSRTNILSIQHCRRLLGERSS